MRILKLLSCFAALALAAALMLPGSAAAAAVAPGLLAEPMSQVAADPVHEVRHRWSRSGPRYQSRRITRPRSYSRRPHVRRYDRHFHGPRYRSRRPGFHFYGGWWYAFPWWLGVAPYYYEPRPRYAPRCDYWHQQCVRNWGYGNPNYRGCMRYHQCW